MVVVKNEVGKLPYGSYTKKDHVLSIIVEIFVGLFVGALFILMFILTDSFILSLLSCVIPFVVLVFIVGTQFNQLNRVLKKYEKDFDFNALESKLQLFLGNKLHSESRNELLMQYANLLLNYDKERALIMWRNVKPCAVQHLVCNYYNIIFEIEKGNFDNAKDLYNIFKVKYQGKMYEFFYKSIENQLLVFASDEICEDVESKIVYNPKKRFSVVNHLCLLLHYYYSRGIIDKAKEYALLIKKENAGFIEIDKLVKRVLEEE